MSQGKRSLPRKMSLDLDMNALASRGSLVTDMRQTYLKSEADIHYSLKVLPRDADSSAFSEGLGEVPTQGMRRSLAQCKGVSEGAHTVNRH